MNKLRQWMDRLWHVLKVSVHRFPETLLISLALVLVLIVDNHRAYDPDQVLVKLAMVFALGVPLSGAIKLLVERLKLGRYYRAALAIVMVVYCGLFYVLIPDNLDQKFTMRYAMATAIAYFLFTLVPYLWQRANYSLYCVKLLVSFFITYLYTLVLYLGVIAIIFAVDFLFELNISEKIYFDTFVSAVGLFGLTYFLGKVPSGDNDISEVKYPTVLRVLLVSIVVPLISVYTLVLHAYLIRVLISIGWSDGFVSQLVIWYGFVSVVLMVLLYPLIDESKLVKGFYRYYPYAMIIPLIMLAITMMIRVNAYGLTILRSLVLIAWLWFLVSVGHVILFKGRISQNLIIGFILIFGLATFSPINVFTISDQAQTKRLTGLLESSGILVADVLVPQTSIDEASQVLISDLVMYLETSGGLAHVTYLPDGFESKDMKEIFGFDYRYQGYLGDDFGTSFVNYYNKAPYVTDIAGYEYYVSITSNTNPSNIGSDRINVLDKDLTLEVWVDGQKIYESAIDTLLKDVEIPQTVIEDSPPLSLEVDQGWGSMKLIFRDINGEMTEDHLTVTYYSTDVFLKLK